MIPTGPRCATAVLAVALTAAAAPLRQATGSTGGVDFPSLDPAVRPQDDLFLHVNGRWVATTPMPPENTNYGVFIELADRAERDVRTIVEEIAARGRPPKGSREQQVVDLYASLMDEGRLDELGARPIEPVLRRIDAIATGVDFAREAGTLASTAGGGPFETTVGLDHGDSTRIVAQLAQSGAMLPDRDHYLSDDPRYARIRTAYVAYLTTIFDLTGRADAARDARAVLALETELARAQTPATAPRAAAPEAYTLDALGRELPGFAWRAWAEPQRLDRASVIVLMQPAFFRRFVELAATTPLGTWKAWLAARYITVSAPFLASPFADARFEFFGRTLSGQVEARTRWRRAVSLVNGYLGDSVGRLYVEKHFPAAAKARSGALISTLLEAFRAAIRESSWMSASTRRAALDKLSRLDRKIGAPSDWRDYQGLEIDPGDLLGNVHRAQQFQNRQQMQLLVGPRRRAEWLMPPQTVNAYYSTELNEIVVPAGILQPPLFDPAADDAVNYGAIGAMIGHEIAHGFDERGRLFDGTGARKDWWSPEDEREFQRRAGLLVRQFDTWCADNGLRPGGHLTLRENLGDVVGLSIAFRAYRIALGGRPSPVLNGTTGEQRFFLAWAQVWRWKIRPEYLDQWALSSPHAHPHFRVNGPASNLPGFYEAFGVTARDRLFRRPEERVTIW